ncbi:MAG: DeoR/GlpR family DNA-binding transcription regulator [Flavobacteriaceae bacterium]|nr:DeoR/GlpR family DNA-binding transcription regulator [Flavobacteriaceae bacterium]
MLKAERQRVILKKLQQEKKVLSTALSEFLKVSEDTVRRDLNEMAAQNLIQKVHGGALLIQDTHIPSYAERSVDDVQEKRIIAQKAVSHIKDGKVVLMSGSTTNLQLAKIIPDTINATIYTYSLPIALELTKHPNIEVIFIGGKLNKPAQVTVGLDVITAISKLRADVCFMGTGGMDLKHGLTEPDWEVSRIKKSMIENSKKIMVLCAQSKLDTECRHKVCHIEEIDFIITDLENTDHIFDVYKEKGVTIL